ncbi:MAG: hypothetical protein J0G98_03660 [Terrimonas ferruginea]|uniref:STM3941 family protein n=1 Tax=Terrimonas ferruginea TaxID=249 RepID=UPI000928B96F|nr:STM3941 family protein [Terrimonas ferruginea]MBN8782137.1 hypothetical protein [Terrimonas ferruginea]OJW42675.1 MAG: hypothetical protein BGO56_11520 [Sphingobacteriales bacterium 48-107]
MTLTVPIEIQSSRKKLVFALIASIVFVAIGAWMLVAEPLTDNIIFGNPTFVLVSGATCVAFFGLMAIILLSRLNKPLKGLIITAEGIEDHSSVTAAGFVPWTDVRGIRDTRVFNQQFIVVVVHNPQEYIDRQGNFFKRKSAQSNFKMYGSPVIISANSLTSKFEDLKRLLQEQHYQFKNRHAH